MEMEKIIFKTQNAEIKIIDRMDITGSSHHSGDVEIYMFKIWYINTNIDMATYYFAYISENINSDYDTVFYTLEAMTTVEASVKQGNCYKLFTENDLDKLDNFDQTAWEDIDRIAEQIFISKGGEELYVD